MMQSVVAQMQNLTIRHRNLNEISTVIPHVSPQKAHHAKCQPSRLPVLDAANERRILNAATAVRQAGDRSVVAEALELVLHRLRQDGALNIRVLRSLGRELGIEVGRVKGVGL